MGYSINATTKKISMIQGDSATILLKAYKSDGTVLVITGNTVYFTIRAIADIASADDTDVILQKSTADDVTITDGSAGEFSVGITSAESLAIASGKYYYDCRFINGSTVHSMAKREFEMVYSSTKSTS